MLAIDIKYHTYCYVKYVQRSAPSAIIASEESLNDTATADKIAGEVEFVRLMEVLLGDTEKHYDMNDLHEKYVHIMKAHGITDLVRSNQYINNIIVQNIEDVHFARLDRRQAEVVISTRMRNKAVQDTQSKLSLNNDLQKVIDCPSWIRKDVFNKRKEPWIFDGTLGCDSTHRDNIPLSLYSLICWILQEQSKTTKLEALQRNSSLHKSTMCFAQSLVYELKTDRQVTYEPTKAEVHFKHRDATENCYVLGVGLKVHSLTRSRQLIDYLHKLGISPTYDRILRIETKLAEAVLENMTQTGVYVPYGLKLQQPVFFAADNIDFDEDTPDGKSTLHATIVPTPSRSKINIS